jgi:hypothetical protein
MVCFFKIRTQFIPTKFIQTPLFITSKVNEERMSYSYAEQRLKLKATAP